MSFSVVEASEAVKVLRHLRQCSFPQQWNTVVTPASERFLAIMGTRRSSKSMFAAIRAVKRALSEPGYKAIYVSLTHKNVSRDWWMACVKKLLIEGGWNGDLPVDLPWKLSNGSLIDGASIDNSDSARKKIRGSFWDDVFIDEAQSWRHDLEETIYSVIRPALLDRLGHCFVMGTPGDTEGTFWYKIVHSEIGGWKFVKFDWRANPYMIAQCEAEIEEIRQNNPEYLLGSKFAREMNGEWVTDSSILVYEHSPANLLSPGYKMGPDEDYIWICGVDPGFRGGAAIAVCAWPKRQLAPGRDTFIVVHLEKHREMQPGDVQKRVASLCEKYHVVKCVVDSADPAFIEALRLRHFINVVEGAKKLGKYSHQRNFNSDLQACNIMLHHGVQTMLIAEWSTNVWNRDKLKEGEREENPAPGVGNHCSDAVLYAYTRARHFWSERVHEPVAAPTADEVTRKFLENVEREEAQFAARRNDPNDRAARSIENYRRTFRR